MMAFKLPFLKRAAALAFGVVLAGFFLFGRDFFSYIRTSARVVQSAAREQVSVEFELQRARDLVDQIVPKLQAHVQLIAQDEVGIAALEKDIAGSRARLKDHRDALAGLREKLAVKQVAYRSAGREMSREQLAQELSQQFDRCRESELILSSKEELLATRRQSLQAAMQMLDRAKHQKLQLEQRIEHLVAQHRLVQAQGASAGEPIEGADLSQAEDLLTQIQTRIDVSQRVLAHGADLRAVNLPDEVVDEAQVLAQVDAYFDQESQKLAAVNRE